jgi:hypothetical protein
MNKLATVKLVAKSITGMGAAYIVHSIIKNNTNPDDLTSHVKVYAGSFALGMMVADITSRYTENQIDNIADAINQARQK